MKGAKLVILDGERSAATSWYMRQTRTQEEGNCGNWKTFLKRLEIMDRQRLLDNRFFQCSFFRSHRLESRNGDLNHIRVRLTGGQALEPKIWGDQRFRPGVAQ